jgi:hypothetical protein
LLCNLFLFSFNSGDNDSHEDSEAATKDNSFEKPRPKSVPVSVEESDDKSQPVLTSFEMKDMA